MILATAILLIGIYSTELSAQESLAPPQPTQQSEANSSSNPQTGQEQNGTTPAALPQTKSSPSAAQQSSGSQKSHAAKKHVSKKSSSATACDAASATSGSTGSASGPPSGAPGGPETSPTQASATPKNCPPEKIVVQQGGTTDPSIQLAGGDQASQKRDAANHMLGFAQENLKKIAGLQLSAAQKDTVSQIHQFVDQSKAALAAGDVERGSTLAWKAQLLSEDLVPQK